MNDDLMEVPQSFIRGMIVGTEKVVLLKAGRLEEVVGEARM